MEKIKNDEKTDTISTIEETKSQDEVEIDDYVSDEEFDEAILFPKKCKRNRKIFFQKNWQILYEVEGDLNNDNLNDIALIIENTDSGNIRRMIVLVLKL